MTEHPFIVSVLIDMGDMNHGVYAGILWASDKAEATLLARRDALRDYAGAVRIVQVAPVNATMLDRFRIYVNGGLQRTIPEE